ncbi:MAG: hypothetical protein NTV93_04080 [Verrucomicrobia bacterium]|nr:hypothetical protein [Verrucomicrobiota bacterium]
MELNLGSRSSAQPHAGREVVSGVWSDGNLITTCPASSSRITISPIIPSMDRNMLGGHLSNAAA